jgi:copper chaperone CopZ
LERLPGVKRALVSRQTEEARVVYDDSKQTPAKLAAAIDRLGFQARVVSVIAAPRPTLHVEGLTDLKGVRKAEEVLRAIKGVKGVVVDARDGEVFVERDSTVALRDLLAALEAAGFKARLGTQ